MRTASAPPRTPARWPCARQNPIRPSQLITEHSVENALRVLLALGGSTNAMIHLTAIAGRRGIRSICTG